MSVVLYRKGDERVVKGFPCDILLVEPESFNLESIPNGWFLTPEKAYEEVKQEETKVLKGNSKIRNDAKEAGIEDWETARIATLKDRLKA